MTLFIELGCLYCKQTQRAFNNFKNTLNWLKIDSVHQKFNWLECGNLSQDAGTPGTEWVIGFSQLAVKGLKSVSWRSEDMIYWLWKLYVWMVWTAKREMKNRSDYKYRTLFGVQNISNTLFCLPVLPPFILPSVIHDLKQCITVNMCVSQY
jgi:hypothetical protein